MTKPLVAYFPVSTREQGRSGLGIDAQRAAVRRFAETESFEVVAEFEEHESGKGSLAEPLIDTTSDFKELILAIFGIAAKLERRRIIERTARGRADAKAKGVKFGRKPILTEFQRREAIKRRDKDGETLRSIARSYDVSAATISRLYR